MQAYHEALSHSKIKARVIPVCLTLVVGLFLGLKLFQDGSVYRNPLENAGKKIVTLDKEVLTPSPIIPTNVSSNNSTETTNTTNTTINPTESKGNESSQNFEQKYLNLTEQVKLLNENISKFLGEVEKLNETISKNELKELVERYSLGGASEKNP